MNSKFSDNFLWGAATAAAQIEGGWNEGGRTPSVWDTAPKGKIKGNADCHTACDHFHRVKEDIALMKKMGLKSYRFSISWSRIQPRENEINQKGLDFYINLVDELRKANIEPLVTIYHWDLPIWVQKKGGFLSEEIIPLFEKYTKIVVDALSDKVTNWIPMNEPQCFIMLGYCYAVHAPFKFGLQNIPKASRICMLAHARSVRQSQVLLNAIRAVIAILSAITISLGKRCLQFATSILAAQIKRLSQFPIGCMVWQAKAL